MFSGLKPPFQEKNGFGFCDFSMESFESGCKYISCKTSGIYPCFLVGFHNKRKRYMEFFADLMQCGVKEIVSYW